MYSADEQEARSIRYACGLRLALLSSGSWACWFGDRLEIWPEFFVPKAVLEFAQAEAAARELWWSEAASRRTKLLLEDSQAARVPVQQASKDAGELGL